MKTIFYLFAIIVLCGCQNNQQKTESKNQNDNVKVEHSINKDASNDNLTYEPDTSLVSGRILEKVGYGAPGFGEDTFTDKKEKYFALNLNHTYKVVAGKDDDLNETEEDIKVIQLVGDNKEIRPFLGKNVAAKGVLFHSDNGHHHEKVLMKVVDLQLSR